MKLNVNAVTLINQKDIALTEIIFPYGLFLAIFTVSVF